MEGVFRFREQRPLRLLLRRRRSWFRRVKAVKAKGPAELCRRAFAFLGHGPYDRAEHAYSIAFALRGGAALHAWRVRQPALGPAAACANRGIFMDARACGKRPKPF